MRLRLRPHPKSTRCLVQAPCRDRRLHRRLLQPFAPFAAVAKSNCVMGRKRARHKQREAQVAASIAGTFDDAALTHDDLRSSVTLRGEKGACATGNRRKHFKLSPDAAGQPGPPSDESALAREADSMESPNSETKTNTVAPCPLVDGPAGTHEPQSSPGQPLIDPNDLIDQWLNKLRTDDKADIWDSGPNVMVSELQEYWRRAASNHVHLFETLGLCHRWLPRYFWNESQAEAPRGPRLWEWHSKCPASECAQSNSLLVASAALYLHSERILIRTLGRTLSLRRHRNQRPALP